jgi:NADH-quinone oxidoreductase subunit N
MGIPPFAGFFGKLYIFSAAVNKDMAWFAAVGALNSVIAAFYYIRVIKTMIIEPCDENMARISIPWTGRFLIWMMLIPTLGLPIFWKQIEKLTLHSLKLFLG